MKIFTSETLEKLPSAQSVRLIGFEDAQVIGGFINDTYILTVSGTKPYMNMEVRLSPVIYTHQPDYWEIEVVGVLSGFGLPALAPYSVSLPLDGILGIIGVEVVGANARQQIVVPYGEIELGNQDGDVKYRANQSSDGVLIIAEGINRTSGYDNFFEQSPNLILPPQFILKQRKPSGPSLDVLTPFTARTLLQINTPVEEITVHDAQGSHQIVVDQTTDK
ncbi:MAG TPA: hypothetical protein PKE69_15900 [Pyrinomonadaceae bacterium]|nr:hypothetical protein [Pyrinomonadaceae bacterium]